MKPKTRSEAKERGSITYRTNKPCYMGHISDRYTCNSACVECERLNRLNRELKLSRKEYHV